MVYYAREEYVAEAGQTDFTISFPYLSSAHLIAYVNGVEETDWTLPTSSTLRFDTALSEGDVVLIQRSSSPNELLVDWATATVITEDDLDAFSLQLFYLSQEAYDRATASGLPVDDATNQYTANNKQIKELADPTDTSDAVTKGYVDDLYVAAGNVPTPDNPGDNNKALVASSGTYDWSNISTSALSVSSDVKDILDCADTAAVRTELGLGTAALLNTGTSTDNVVKLDTGGVMPAVGLGSMTDISTWVPLDSENLHLYGSDTVDLTPSNLEDYQLLRLVLAGIESTGDNDNLFMRWKMNGAWVTGSSDYSYSLYYVQPTVDTYGMLNSSASGIRLTYTDHLDSENELYLELIIYNDPDAFGDFPFCTSTHGALRVYSTYKVILALGVSGYAKLEYPIQGIRLYLDTNNFEHGRVYLYGANSLV